MINNKTKAKQKNVKINNLKTKKINSQSRCLLFHLHTYINNKIIKYVII
jgi:hypothetical protein